jgi:hypothetical protein
MNQATRDIMALLKIDADTAIQVQNQMGALGFDFSASSRKAFNREAKICFAVIKGLSA